jgi:hypothetical protein
LFLAVVALRVIVVCTPRRRTKCLVGGACRCAEPASSARHRGETNRYSEALKQGPCDRTRRKDPRTFRPD